MKIFISDKLEKQIDNEISNRKDIISRLNSLVQKIKTYRIISDCYNDKGFKQFRGCKYPIYGFDIGLNSSSTMAGERLIVSFLDLNDSNYNIFKRVIEEEELKTEKQGIIFHKICKHDEQGKTARDIAKTSNEFHEYIDAEKYFSSGEIKSINDEIELKSKFKMIKNSYDSQKVIVLTSEKYNIIDKFVYDTKPVFLSGVAGSGKTEIIIKTLHDISKNCPDKKLLYITLSLDLKDNVQKKCETFEHDNIRFETVKSLYGRYIKTNNYEDFNVFNDFVENDLKKYIPDHVKLNKALQFIEKSNVYNVYSEIYGLIYGYMLSNWSRENSYMLSLSEYIDIHEDYKMFEKNEQHIIYEIAQIYEKYCIEHNYSLYNRDSIDILKHKNIEKYDYIFVDEVQDLTEVQINTIYSLLRDRNNIFLSGDEKQVIHPTFFKKSRMYQLFLKYGKDYYKTEPLNSNFRNSKAVIELINYYNSIRKNYLPALKVENMVEEESKNYSSGNVYNFIGDTDELIEKINDSANSAIIIDEKEYNRIKKENKIDMRTIYTAQKCKGIEFDNVLTMNMLSAKKDLYEDLYKNGKSKDSSLHYNFNLFYVAITRTIYNLVMYEEFETKILKELMENVNSITKISNINELELMYDKDARSFMDLGRKNLAKKDYERALKNFEKAKEANNIEEIDYNELEKYIAVSKIYMKYQSDRELAQIFESHKYYDFAKRHYEESNNHKKAALMCLLMKNSDNEFKSIVLQEKINVFDLYSNNNEYNNAIDAYFKREYNTISDITDENKVINEIIKEEVNRINL